MGIFSEGFDDTGGWLSSLWTKNDYGTASTTLSVGSGAGILTTTTASGDQNNIATLVYNPKYSVQDGDLLCNVTLAATVSEVSLIGLRFDGNATNPTGYYVGVAYKSTDTYSVTLYKTSATRSPTAIGSSANVSSSSATLSVRIRIVGDRISIRVWGPAFTETVSFPNNTWTLTAVDTTVTAAGYMCLGAVSTATSSTNQARTFDSIDLISPNRATLPSFNLITSAATTGSSLTITTASFTPKPNTYYLIFLMNCKTSFAAGDLCTISSTNGLTLSAIDNVSFNSKKITLYEGYSGLSPTSGTVTFTAPTNLNTSWAYLVVEILGPNVSGTMKAYTPTLITQSASTSPTPFSFTQPETSLHKSFYIGFILSSSGTVPTVDSGWTAGSSVTSSSPSATLHYQYNLTGTRDYTPAWTTASASSSQVGVELLVEQRGGRTAVTRQAVKRAAFI